MEKENTPAPTALVPVADGSEEIETVCIVDILRRAGVEVTVAVVGTGGNGTMITASRGMRLAGDCLLEECRDSLFAAIVLPGGLPGAEHLRDNDLLRDLLLAQDLRKGIVAAICASPAVVLQHHDLIRERRATCYPSLLDRLPATSRSAEPVVTADNLITSRGPGTAMEFALELVRTLCGQEKRAEIAGQLLLN